MRDIAAIRNLLLACDYEPIGHYGIVGDCRSAALVSLTGSIDWLCLPDFSAPSVFAALLDRRQGGRFLVRPRDVERIQRRYVGDSAVLETLFHCTSGVVRLTDFMPLPTDEASPHRLVRIVSCRAGKADIDVAYQPRPDYARARAELEPAGEQAWRFRQGGASFLLQSAPSLERGEEGDWLGETWHLTAGEEAELVFTYTETPGNEACEGAAAELKETLQGWHAWRSQGIYRGGWPQAVLRSCLTLKLLAYRSSGAVMAALTTSLPESMDAGRNWDYRFCWLRDTSLLLQSFVDIGFEDESAAFFGWLLKVGRASRLEPLYDLHGRPVAEEIILPHLEGYRGRGPVRIGNAAHQQLQLDIYGEVMQTAYRFVTRGGELNIGERRLLANLGTMVCQLWRHPDQSIWETRSPPRHYTYSKLMCWVALDRLLALQARVDLGIDGRAIEAERNLIRQEIDSRGFNADLGSYVGYFGGTEPDASLLLMLRYGYLHQDDPRLVGTYRYIMAHLSVDGFLYRYPPGKAYDGVGGGENLFAVCSFWEVDYQARSGHIDEAVRLFERLLGLANDLGLYAEQFDAATRQPLGNFPQAFTHSGLVTAALAIDQAMAGKRGLQVSA